jgi:signal transduction histidine kinase
MILFGGCVGGEYMGLIKHYELGGFAAHNLYQSTLYVFGTFFIFTTTLYLVVYMTTSVTAQLRKQRKECERANLELQQKDNLKNEYVLRVTHDIKGHLAAIESCLDVILNDLAGPVDPTQRDLIERANRRASRCMAFIKALLRLTRMKLTGELDMENFSIRNAIFNTLTSIERRAAAKNIQVTHTIDEGVDEICGEPVLIEEAIVNILYNAARYTPENGRIHISAADEGQTILIQISDTGIGIPAGDEEKIFEEFYRAENAREVERDGTGLGLSIAKQVVDRHHGQIFAKNNEEAGSTFSIRLPKQPTQK